MEYEKICQICGKKFMSKSPKKIICYENHYKICPDCGVSVLWNSYETFKGCKKCNQKRAVILRKQTMKQRYGGETTLQSEVLKQRVKSTVHEKYGVDNVMQNKTVQDKASSTNLTRYGSPNPMGNSEISKKSANNRYKNIDKITEKIKLTFNEKYGVDNPSQLKEVQDKITASFVTKYGVKRASQIPEFKQKMIDTMMEKYGVPYYTQTEEYRHHKNFRISKINKKFANLLECNNIKYESEFAIGYKSYDFHIIDTNILIEINPSYTHNIVGNHWNRHGIDANYHLQKTQIAKEAGFRCIHIWDWDDWNKILDIILPKKKIYAKQLKIYKLNYDVSKDFIQKYHLQGNCRGQVLCVGLVDEIENKIYEVMTFGKSRYNKSFSIELLRFCSLRGYTVVGGVSKLFKFVTNAYDLSNVITYCDASKFTGEVYNRLGMSLINTTRPQLNWSNGNKLITNNLLVHKGFNNLFNTNYAQDKSNDQLMIENGWLPVYDCGKMVFGWRA